MAQRGKQSSSKRAKTKRRLNLGKAPLELLKWLQAPELPKALAANAEVWAKWWASLPSVSDADRRVIDRHELDLAVRAARAAAAARIAPADGLPAKPKAKAPVQRKRTSTQLQVMVKILETAYADGTDDYQVADILKAMKDAWVATCEVLKIPKPWPRLPSRQTVTRHLGR